MTTAPSFGSAPTWSSSAPTVGDEAAAGRVLGDRVGDALGGAEVRAVEHQQRRVVRGRTGGAARRGAGGCRRGAAGRAATAPAVGRAPGPQPDLDVEVVGLDRQRLLGLELVVGVVDRARTAAGACRARASPPAARTAGRCRRAARCRTACRRSAGSSPRLSGLKWSGSNASGPRPRPAGRGAASPIRIDRRRRPSRAGTCRRGPCPRTGGA